ncbi:MAG: hypothetical protein CL592_09660, partial [Alteromonas sp.]|nr:hypothetical protein [Alteromonas sp.]
MHSAATGPWQTVWLQEAQHGCSLLAVAPAVLSVEEDAPTSALLRLSALVEAGPGCEAVDGGVFLVAAVSLDGHEVARAQGSGPFTVDLNIKEPRL